MAEPIEVGVGATHAVGSDRYPYTVVEVVNERRIVVQRDEFRRTDSNGLSESQEYEYTPNPNAEKLTLTLRRRSRFAETGAGRSRGSRSSGTTGTSATATPTKTPTSRVLYLAGQVDQQSPVKESPNGSL